MIISCVNYSVFVKFKKIRLIIEGEADKVEWPRTKKELKESYFKINANNHKAISEEKSSLLTLF